MTLLLAAAMAAAAATAPMPDAHPVRVVSADGAPVSLELVGPLAGPSAGAAPAAAAEPAAQSMPNLYQVPAHCRNLAYQVVDSQGRPVATRLGDLPGPGGLQLLVDRRISGCRVITVKYGTVAPDQPNPPADRYQIRPLAPPPGRR